MNIVWSNSQGAAVDTGPGLSSEQGYGLDRRLTAVSAFPSKL